MWVMTVSTQRGGPCPISIHKDSISVQLGGNIKKCCPAFNVRFVRFLASTKDKNLYVCRTLHRYLEHKEQLQEDSGEKDGRLFISFIKPHNSVSRHTAAWWIKHMLALSGVETAKYTASSVCAAATSWAKVVSVPLRHILSKVGWSRESNFTKHYNKEIIQEGDPFQDAVLD